MSRKVHQFKTDALATEPRRQPEMAHSISSMLLPELTTPEASHNMSPGSKCHTKRSQFNVNYSVTMNKVFGGHIKFAFVTEKNHNHVHRTQHRSFRRQTLCPG